MYEAHKSYFSLQILKIFQTRKWKMIMFDIPMVPNHQLYGTLCSKVCMSQNPSWGESYCWSTLNIPQIQWPRKQPHPSMNYRALSWKMDGSLWPFQGRGPYCQWVLPPSLLLNQENFILFCIWLPILSHVILVQIKSEVSITHEHTLNCSSTCPYHCCSPHVGSEALVIWIASSSGASEFHFGSQNWGIL